MMIRDPKGRRWARHASRTATLVAGAMLALSAWATVDQDLDRAAAAPVLAGPAKVVQASTGANPGVQMDTGALDSDFSLALPAGAECPGDSANDGWRVTSYLVAASTAPATLTFNSDGPTANQFGAPQESHRQPLYDASGSPYIAAQTAAEDPEGSGGTIINVPDYTLGIYVQTDPAFSIPAGEYNIGIACVHAAGPTYPIDRYWNVEIEIIETAGAWSWEADQPAATTITVDAPTPSSPQPQGTSVNLQATVTPAEAAGTVAFKHGGTAIPGTVTFAGGVATLTTTELPVGSHDISATFTPTDPLAFAASTSTPVSYEITGTGVTSGVTLNAAPAADAKTGDEVTLTATVTPADTAGTVSFSNGGTVLGAAAAGQPAGSAAGTWVATFKTTTLAAGTHSLVAAFDATDPAVTDSTSTALSYTVAQGARATTVTLKASPKDESEEGEEVTLTATVTPTDAAGTITFKDGTDTLDDPVAVASGKAELDIDDLKVGDHDLTATFTPTNAAAFATSTSATLEFEVVEAGDGDEEEEAEATTISVIVSPADQAPPGTPVTITATVSPVAAGTVSFKDGETEIGSQATDAEGKAMMTISTLAAGPHSFSATFTPTDAEAFAASSTTTPVSFQIGAATSAETGGGTTDGAATGDALSAGASGPTTSGSPLGQLPLTGGSLSLVLWSLALLVFGRIAILLARSPEIAEARA